jgi:acyl transferase domain-containing protein
MANTPNNGYSPDDSAIAIIGMSCRMPGACNVDEFWRNLSQGVESISFFTQEEMLADGVDPAMVEHPDLVPAQGILPDIDRFDADFFGYSPREAALIDPQQRVLLEGAVEALEHAGYDPATYPHAIGVYAGGHVPMYLLENLYGNPSLPDYSDAFQMVIGNGADFIPTRVAYKLNLKGPAVNVQTACTTSLVAAHLACQALLTGECAIALAGGAGFHFPQKSGYLSQEGMILSPDGHTRAFDAKAQGCAGGNGAGLVVLKRLAEALEDGDAIYAVVRGSAINNDGAAKVGYTAPSVEGQAEVIREALAMAGVDPAQVSYVETHGTATALGDPIEIAALTRAYREYTDRKSYCAIGTVKTNIGHVRAAAGVAGLIKTAQALHHGLIPPSLHFETPHPQIDFANSPFFVNTRLREWKTESSPRLAGVSAFGIGGTNAHMILEEAPAPAPSGPSRDAQLLVLSAKTPAALATATDNLAEYLGQNLETPLADIAYTLQRGRQAHALRRALVCHSAEDALAVLAAGDPARIATGQGGAARPVTFLFPGGGAQYVGMGRELYQTEPVFRAQVDACADRLREVLGFDLRERIYAEPTPEARQRMEHADLGLPALFVTEYALAKLWMIWGIQPQAMLGHSLGEYVAACLAGVFSLGDALRLVALRGRLFETLPAGAMLTVLLPEAELLPLLAPDHAIAAINTASSCVVSGTEAAIARLENRLAELDLVAMRLPIAVAAHCPLVAPILQEFGRFVRTLTLQAPSIPFVSNFTGDWIRPDEATDPGYWIDHLRHTVRFMQGVETLLQAPERLFLEIGPGRTLGTYVQQHPAKTDQAVLSSLRYAAEPGSDTACLLDNLGRLWVAGAAVDWEVFYAAERRRRVPLPTYPFERKRCWIEFPRNGKPRAALLAKLKPDDWFYAPHWTRTVAPAAQETARHSWLLLVDACGVGARLAEKLADSGHAVITVAPGLGFAQTGANAYTLDPASPADYAALAGGLAVRPDRPTRIVHAFGLMPPGEAALADLERAESLGFFSLIHLAQALGQAEWNDPLQITALTNNAQEVVGDDLLCPEQALLIGAVKVIPREYASMSCCAVDLALPASEAKLALLAEQLLAETAAHAANGVIAYRGKYRWTQSFRRVPMPALGEAPTPRLRQNGVYLITGGLGGVGLAIAAHLARRVRAKLVLLGRSAFPAPEHWDAWLAEHGPEHPTSRKLLQFREWQALGAEVLAQSADVANFDEMRQAVAAARARFGRIDGVIHSAGVIPSGDTITIQHKTRAAAERVLAPKARGTLVLERLFREQAPDFLVLCASAASMMGGVGQSDYAAANAFQDAYAHHIGARGGLFATAIGWGTWKDAGLAAEFAGQWLSVAPESTRFEPIRHPLFEQRAIGAAGDVIYALRLCPARHWLVGEHRVMGQPTLVGTAYLELARAALADHSGRTGVEIRELYLLNPLTLGEQEECELRVALTPQGDAWTCSILSRTGPATAWREHAHGEIALLAETDSVWHDFEALAARCRKAEIDLKHPDYRRDTGFVEVSARWENLCRVQLGEDQGLGFLSMPPAYAADSEVYGLHPALLDEATSFLLGHKNEGPHLPFRYKGVRIRENLPARLYSYIEYQQDYPQGAENPGFQIVLFDETGWECLAIAEYSLRKIQPAGFDQAEAAGASAGIPAPAALPHKTAFQDHLESGMTGPEGAEAFERVLSGSLPHVLVLTVDLDAYLEHERASLHEGGEKEAAPAIVHARPALSTAYAAPRNDTEHTVAGVFENLLGIDRIGIHDNFFHLGGNSLLATQVLARIKQATGIRLPIAAFFAGPTVAELAEQATLKQLENARQDALADILAEVAAMADGDAVASILKDR